MQRYCLGLVLNAEFLGAKQGEAPPAPDQNS